MKTTLEIDDELYREAKAHASLTGRRAKLLPSLITVLLVSLSTALHAAEPTAESKPVSPAKSESTTKPTVPRQSAPFTPAADLKGAWSFTADPKLPNVLIIGDSISIGYTRAVREKLAGKANVYRPMNGKGPDNCGDTTISLNKIDGWLGKQKWDVIHFNWGLWDLCYRDPKAKAQGNRNKATGKISTKPADYGKNLERLIKRLEATGAKLIWANTTVVPEGETGRYVGDDEKFNAIAARVMQKHSIATDDLFSLTKGFAGKFSTKAGDVHYTPAGYEKIAEQVAAKIEASLSPTLTKFLAILQMADLRGKDKAEWVEKMERLSGSVSKLTAKEMSELYQLISKDIPLESEIGEFLEWHPDLSKWTLIGVILAESTERELIVNILINTPPASVKFVNLGMFLKQLDPSILEEVVLGSAKLHSKHRQTDKHPEG